MQGACGTQAKSGELTLHRPGGIIRVDGSSRASLPITAVGYRLFRPFPVPSLIEFRIIDLLKIACSGVVTLGANSDADVLSNGGSVRAESI